MPRPTGQHKQEEKGPERTWMESGSCARGAPVRRGERTGTPASLPGRRIRLEETAPTMLYYAHRPPSPGRGLNTHGDKARAGRRGNTWRAEYKTSASGDQKSLVVMSYRDPSQHLCSKNRSRSVSIVRRPARRPLHFARSDCIRQRIVR